MRRTVIALGLLFCPASLLAAPVPAGQAAAAPINQASLQAAAREYAQGLEQILRLVEENYARSVRPADLVEVALTGLYEAAGVPVPGGLKGIVKQAEKDQALVPLLTRTRAGLGNPESLQGRRALLASARAVMRSLDPFCAVVTGAEATTATGYDQNSGLGIDLVEKSGAGPLVIKDVVPGGPAQRVGLQPGDHITRIDDKETKALTTDQALRLLNGAAEMDARGMMILPPGMGGPEIAPTSVRVTIRGAGRKEERTLSLLREQFEPETVQGVTRASDNSWDYWLDRKKGVAQVRIAALAQHTAQELDRVLGSLEGGEGLHGLILDLRWCPGGYLTPSIDAAGLFLKDGHIATIKSRTEGDRPQPVRDDGGHKYLNFPIVVLVNAETSGGGELIAAALQDHKRAVVAGQRTRGKASIQNQVMVPVEGGRIDGTLQLKLTNGTFLRPSGRTLNRFADSKASDDWGVRPDPKMELRVSAELGRQLKEWWREQSLRPGTSNKVLPLDDLEQDPQRQAALKALLRLMAEKK